MSYKPQYKPGGIISRVEQISRFTTQELVDELCKREGVVDFVVAGDSRCWITNEGNIIHYKVSAPATILVIKC